MQGVGKRTAERIVVELREKVGAAPADDPIVIARGDDPRMLARDGLVGLGFSPQEADELLDGAAGRDDRGPDRPRAQGVAAMSEPIRTPGVTAVASTASRRPSPAPRTSSTSRSARAGSTSSSARRR